MKTPFYSDNHMHSSASFDAAYSVEEMAAASYEHGLSCITITDHRDCPVFLFDNSRAMMGVSRYSTQQAAKDWQGKLEILFGVELGEPLQEKRAAQEILRHGPYDFVIGSLHNLEGEEDFYFLNYEQHDPRDLLRRYFSELLEMVLWGQFDTLAHVTYPLRYMPKGMDLTPFADAIDRVFHALIQKQIALEVNASGFRQEIGESLPGEDLLRRYHQLGGRLITVGADAHAPADTGCFIPLTCSMLRRLGFTEYMIYRKRRPCPVPLGEE
ncbi:MAG: histidinol-phosphatase HisJ family protein [Acutalibacteraceae bacterium]